MNVLEHLVMFQKAKSLIWMSTMTVDRLPVVYNTVELWGFMVEVVDSTEEEKETASI